MAGRVERVATAKGFDFGFNADPEPWTDDGWSDCEWRPFSEEAQRNIFDALKAIENNKKIQEISVKVSEYEHYVCVRRINDACVELGQVRVQQGHTLWNERQIVVGERVRKYFQNSFRIVTGDPMQGRRLPGGEESTAERLERGAKATQLLKGHAQFLVTRSGKRKSDE